MIRLSSAQSSMSEENLMWTNVSTRNYEEFQAAALMWKVWVMAETKNEIKSRSWKLSVAMQIFRAIRN